MAGMIGVPLCDVQSQYQELEQEIQQAVLNVLQSGRVILGPQVKGFEEDVAHYCHAGHAIGCASGSDALLLALQALEIGAGDEVILPTFTFFATAGAVVRTGATPVFVDIETTTFNLDPVEVAKKITNKTKAIIAVHLYGQTAEMEPLWRCAEEHQIPIIEDAAQAIGAEYQNKRTGTLGAMACFSFYPSKNLGAAGDAGLVVTSDPEWASLLSVLRVHGMKERYHHRYLGWNSRLDEIQAAVLRVKLPHLDHWTEGRQAAAHRYHAMIEEYRLEKFLQRPTVAKDRRHVFNQYCVRVADNRRNALVQHLKQHQVGCEIYYPIPMHQQECLAFLGYGPGDFPKSETVSQDILALPMFPDITSEQQRIVMETCVQFLQQSRRVAA